MMPKLFNVALVAGAVFMAAGVDAQDQVLECKKTTCVSADPTEDFELSCGSTGEGLKVLFASFGEPDGSCPAANVENFNSSLLQFEATSGCDLAGSLDKVKKLCDGEDECKFKVSDEFKEEGATGLDTCVGAGLELLVRAECKQFFDFFTVVLALVIAMIGLALGASIEIHQFQTIFRKHKRAVAIGFGCQFGIMPLLAYMLCLIFDFPPGVALGLILVGSAPGGTTSNLVTYWSKGSVALSITMSAASTLAALATLPLLVLIYVNGALNLDDTIAIPFGDIAQTLVIAVAPAALGVFIRSKGAKWAKRVEIAGSFLGALFIIVAIYIGVNRNPDLVIASKYPRTWASAMLFQPVGAVFGYIIATLAKLPRPERRAVAIETGIQNTTLVVAMVALSFTGCERLEILTFPLLASLTTLINSAWMSLFLRWMSKFDTDEERADLAADNAILEGEDGNSADKLATGNADFSL